MTKGTPTKAEVLVELRQYLERLPTRPSHTMTDIRGSARQVSLLNNEVVVSDGSSVTMLKTGPGSTVGDIEVDGNIIHARESKSQIELVTLLIKLVEQYPEGVMQTESEGLGRRYLKGLFELAPVAMDLLGRTMVFFRWLP